MHPHILIAMKLNAISTSGQRSKDFIDIFYLLDSFTLEEMIGFYCKKYNQDHGMFVLKSLIWFEEVDLADWPVLLLHPRLSWEAVKKRIEKVVLDYTRSL